jgi:BirA family biotin operon repressor/biotin-[acetyl-CoA-carboxylase] ligase
MTGTDLPLTPTNLEAALVSHPFVTQIIYRTRVGSTNDLAKTLADQGAPEGLLVIADEQSTGRGRMGRRWWSPPGHALLTSLLFRPAPHHGILDLDQRPSMETARFHITAQQLVMLCALAAADAVRCLTGLPVELKWPNDLLVHNRKLAGLLAESIFRGNHLEAVIVGVGINVNTDFVQAPAFIAPATSLRCELKSPVCRLSLLVRYLDEVGRRYAALKAGTSPYTEWADRLATLGQRVTAHVAHQAADKGAKSDAAARYVTGIAEGVDIDGALLLRTDDGVLHQLFAADVSIEQASL